MRFRCYPVLMLALLMVQPAVAQAPWLYQYPYRPYPYRSTPGYPYYNYNQVYPYQTYHYRGTYNNLRGMGSIIDQAVIKPSEAETRRRQQRSQQPPPWVFSRQPYFYVPRPLP
jgi:hypothetical protein